MKNVLKAKLMVLVLILGSIEFVYSGCCQSCKTRGKENQSKSNGNPGGPGNPENPGGSEDGEKGNGKGKKKSDKKEHVEEDNLSGFSLGSDEEGDEDKESKKGEHEEGTEKSKEKNDDENKEGENEGEKNNDEEKNVEEEKRRKKEENDKKKKEEQEKKRKEEEEKKKREELEKKRKEENDKKKKEEQEKKRKEEEEKRIKEEEKKISDFLNSNKDDNRKGIKDNFKVKFDEVNGNFTIKYGRFTGTIAKNDVRDQIGDSKLKIKVTRPDGKTNIPFDNGGECTLGDFVTALGFLRTEFRNGYEYLAVVDANKVCLFGNAVYINLNNGVIHGCGDGYIGRVCIAKQYNGKYIASPCYKSGNFYYYSDKSRGYLMYGNQDNQEKSYSFKIIKKEDIKKFNFKLVTN